MKKISRQNTMLVRVFNRTVLAGILLCAGVLFRCDLSAQGAPQSWQVQSVLPVAGAKDLYGVAYGSAGYVSVGQSGLIYKDQDIVSGVPPVWLLAATFAAQQYVVVGDLGTVLTSPDANGWTSRTSGVSTRLNAITAGAGRLVAAGEQGVVITSDDGGVTWTKRSSGYSGWLRGITYGGGLFVLTGQAGAILTSSDGITWTNRVSGTSSGLDGVTYALNRFVAVGENGTVVVSVDGTSWNAQVVSAAKGAWLHAVCPGPSTGISAVGDQGVLITSADAVTWTNVRTASNALLAVATNSANALVVRAVGQNSEMVEKLPDSPVAANPFATLADPRLVNVSFSNGVFIAVNHNGAIYSSSDGRAWTAGRATPLSLTSSLAYNGQFIVAGGDPNRVAYGFTTLNGALFKGPTAAVYVSTYGSAWNAAVLPTPPSSGFTSYYPGYGYTIAQLWQVGSRIWASDQGHTTTVYSDDGGANWSYPATSPSVLNSYANSGNISVGVGKSGAIARSVDGTTWVTQNSGTVSDLNGVAYGAGRFVGVGAGGTVRWSADGVNWNSGSAPVSAALSSVAYGNGWFVAAGAGGALIYSSDGSQWSTASATGVHDWLSVTAGNGGFVAVAADGAIAATGVTPPVVASTSRISNLSVRTNLATGQTLTVGFVTSGAKSLVLRAVGPSLNAVFGLTGFYPDPKITVFNSQGTTLAQNDDWSSSLSTTFASLGAFPLTAGSKDAASQLAITGPNTAQINGTGPGIVLVEVYDADPAGGPSRLTNVSARNQVGTGTNVLVSGFVIAGTGPRTLLIRGIGPALKDVFGVNGALLDPILEIHQTINGVDTVIASNDNWDASLIATFDKVGAYRFTAGSKDAALLITLQPGIYTAQVAGANNGTGDGVVEVYEVP